MLSLVSFFSLPASVFAADDSTIDASTIKHTVTYHGNGNDTGTAPSDPNSPYFWLEYVTVLAPGDLARTGYGFVEWNTKSNGNGHSYNPNDNFSMPWDNVDLYAQWEPIPGLEITKEVDKTTVSSMDTDVNYTFTITNTGTYDLTNIMLSDPKLGISDLAIPDLAVGAQPYTTTVAFDLGNISYGDWISNVFTNTASVNAKYFKLSKDSVGADCVDPGKSIGPISSSATVTYIPPEPGLTFTKTVDSTVVSSMAATVYYTFTVTNTGECDLRNIEINDDALHIVGLAIPDLDVGDLPYTTTVAFDLEDLDLGDWDGYSFTNIASVTADYGSVLDLTLIRPIDGGQLGPITASAIVTYMPGTLTIYKDVPEVTEDATPFTFVVTEIVYYETASTFFVNEYIPFTTTVAVSENSPYTIYGLPDGQYQVEELTPPAYYTVSGSAIQNVYIGDNGYNQSVTFTNNYYVPPTTTTTTTTRRTRTTTEVVVPEPTPAGPVVTPEVILDEPVLPAAPLPQTGGLDPGFLYGLGALLAGSGLVLRKRKVN
jgi:uncharacterized repeat protein (TIGR02543 family)/LPXTG-motif cell wall-anchored protein